MALTLEQRIDQQDSWTFQQCLGLASELNIKVRAVVVTVYSRGKIYIDRAPAADQASGGKGASDPKRANNADS